MCVCVDVGNCLLIWCCVGVFVEYFGYCDVGECVVE